MKHYYAFGLNVQSDLEFPELFPADSSDSVVDLEIKQAETFFDFQTAEANALDAGADCYWLKVSRVADFLIVKGERIIYRRREGINEDTLRLFILGSCFGCVLQQRGFVVLHGNAVSTNAETCQIIVGHRGAGKSTAAAWHFCQGDRILADDVCAITVDINGIPKVIPSFPQIKLWQTSADLLGISTEGLRRIRPQDEKFALPLGGQFWSAPLRLTEVIELHAENRASHPITGMDKTRCLIEHSYRFHFLKKMGLAPDYTRKLVTLAGLIQIRTGVRVVLGS